MASSRGCRGKRSFKLAEVIRKSDKEVCDDSDTDRDSNIQVSDVEGDSESKRESVTDVADVASDTGDSGSVV